MNKNINLKIISSLLVLAAPAARAQESTPATESPNRFGFNYRMGFNTQVNFKNLGGFTMPTRLTPDGERDQYYKYYNYSDGYAYPDINYPGLGPTTWNWGYDAARAPYKQYSSGDPNVIFHQFTSSPASASSTVNVDDPQSNFELTYNRELLRRKGWRAGLEAAAGYGRVSVNDSKPLAGSFNVASDAYAAQTVYGSGPFQGGDYLDPNALLGYPGTALPGQVGAASITGSRHFDADLFSFRLGPDVEVPLSRRVSLNFSGGLALVYVNSTFQFNQTVTLAGVEAQAQPLPSSGSGSHSAWLPGGYVAGNISVALSEKWALVAGAQFESVGQYTQTVNGKEATLDLSKAIFVTFGLSYSF